MTKEEATLAILAAKKAKKLSFADLAVKVGGHPVWVASVVYGQNSMPEDQAKKLAKALGLGKDVTESLQEYPVKGDLDEVVPVDPLIYRFYEIMQCYGSSMKAVIHEMFGDGIMSAIDFTIDIQKQEDPKGDRVVVTYNGKFLPYKKW